ncbi:Uncharacterised protein [Vibrio cholerae]|nr:Uncharacterised protein [Vibrio cholerae]CSI54520.1 Uncharacterised protein [Vibrio cholerae]
MLLIPPSVLRCQYPQPPDPNETVSALFHLGSEPIDHQCDLREPHRLDH